MSDPGLFVGGLPRGAVYRYAWDGAEWCVRQVIESPFLERSFFGFRLAFVDGRLIVTAPEASPVGGSRAGAVVEYALAASGDYVLSEEIRSFSGSSLIADGIGYRLNAAGADLVVGLVPPRGAVIFRRQGGVWTEIQILEPRPGLIASLFGIRAAASTDTVLMGDPGSTTVGTSGYVDVFRLVGGFWARTQTLIGDGFPGDLFGDGIAIDSERLLVGSSGSAGLTPGGPSARSPWIFREGNDGSWGTAERLDISRLGSVSDPGLLGSAVALIGGQVAVSDYAIRFDDSPGIGAVAIFEVPIGHEFCSSPSGAGARVVVDGPILEHGGETLLRIEDLPASTTGVLFIGPGSPAPTLPAWSVDPLCVGRCGGGSLPVAFSADEDGRAYASTSLLDPCNHQSVVFQAVYREQGAFKATSALRVAVD